MTENRNEKLLNEALRYIAAHTPGEEAYRFLHDQIGITNEELMQYGLDGLRGHFQYEREEGTPWREFAEQMDGLLLRPDVYTTSAWISFAGELAEGVETSFTLDASKLLSAFREIAGKFSPDVVDTVYQVILVPNNALLSHEIFPAAVAAEQGANVQEISDMAASGSFEGGRMDIQQM